ncbi:MAG: transposase family protein [Marinagarivorans sp.]
MSAEGQLWSMPLKGVSLRYMQEQANRMTIGLETQPQGVACRACGSKAVVGYGRMVWRIRDLPVQNKAVLLEIARRRLRCKDCKVTFNEPVANIAEAHRTTTRLAQRLWQLGLYYPFTALAPKFGLDQKTLRAMFSDRFAQTLGQLNRQAYSQAPNLVVLHRPLIQRQRRLVWLNADLDTVVDVNPLLTPDHLALSLKRLGLLLPGAASQVWLPPDLSLVRLLQAQLPVASLVQLRLHPGAVRRQCRAWAAQAGGGPLAAALLVLAQAPSAQAARQAWRQLLAQAQPGDLSGALQELASVLALLGKPALAAFDSPASALDGLLAQLDERLASSWVKRSFDAVCALLLMDKSLQVSARTGLARDGKRLDYQKAHYGTSLERLLAKLAQLPPL